MPNEVAKLRKKIEKEKEERAKKCQDLIQKALKETNCDIVVGMLVTPNGNHPQMNIVPLDAESQE